MHIQYTDLPEPKFLPEGTTLEYATQDQDCCSLERFAIRTLNAGMRAPEIVEQNVHIFEVSAGDLIGHAPGVHHTLIAEKEPIRWYCFCMNRWLMPFVKDALIEA